MAFGISVTLVAVFFINLYSRFVVVFQRIEFPMNVTTAFGNRLYANTTNAFVVVQFTMILMNVIVYNYYRLKPDGMI